MSEHLYNKVIAKLGDHASDVINQAKQSLRQSHDIELEDDTQKRSWIDNIKQDAFALFLSIALFSSLFISAWRIIGSIASGQSHWLLFFAVAAVISESLSEAIMVFRFSVTNELEEKKEVAGKWAWVKYFSLLGILRLFSHLIFGRTFSILHYLLIYLIGLGMLFNLDYELHFAGDAEKLKEIAFAMLPVISIGILSHYLGERVKDAKRSAELSGDMFTRLWHKERYQRVLDVLQATPKKWAQDVLNYAERLEEFSEPDAYSNLSVPSVPSAVGNMAQGAGFMRSAPQQFIPPAENIGKAESGNLAEYAHQVLEAYPDILSLKGKHDKVALACGVTVGRPTSNILKAIEAMQKGKPQQ